MSRRGTRRTVGEPRAAEREPHTGADHEPEDMDGRSAETGASRGAPARERPSAWGDLALILGAFVLASALAGALGAVNLGTALAFGQIGLALMTVYVMLRR
jgi:hypothetical protein